MFLKLKKVIDAGAVVLNSQGKILLIFQSRNKFWDIPKGRKEEGESLEQAFRRELKEETGIEKFELIKDFNYSYGYKFRVPPETLVEEVVWLHLIKTNDEVKLSLEHTDYKWCPLEEAKKLVKHKSQREILNYLEKFAKEKGININ